MCRFTTAMFHELYLYSDPALVEITLPWVDHTKTPDQSSPWAVEHFFSIGRWVDVTFLVARSELLRY